ncbi:MAG: exopolysaccharide biosynthesis polyprenyl glycosylphosphotransferase [Parafilimonas sp.]
MIKIVSLSRVVFLNLMLAGIYWMLPQSNWDVSILIIFFLVNTLCLSIAFHKVGAFIQRHDACLFIGRKRTLLVAMSLGANLLLVSSLLDNTSPKYFFLLNIFWGIFLLLVKRFGDDISIFLHKNFMHNRRIAVVGYNDKAAKLAEQLKQKRKYSFKGHFDNNEFSLHNPEILSSLDAYINLAKEKHINEFYVSLPRHEESKIATLTKNAEKHCIRIRLIAQESITDSFFSRMHYISGFPVLQRYHEPLRHVRNQIIKRTFDLLISGMIIIFILSWLLPLVSLLIKMESRGSVFFTQFRSGRDNDSFKCIKFRSMKLNGVSDIQQASRNDARITRVGAFLRRTSLDEFPQFMNVFKGEMSIVGPRPHMLLHTERYSEQVNNYMARLYLKPGVTGWAQVKGYRGEIKNLQCMEKRVENDIWYMENWSLWLDIKIMYLTALNIIKGDSNVF